MQKKVVFTLTFIFVVFLTVSIVYKVYSDHICHAVSRAGRVDASTIAPNQTGWTAYATGTVVAPGIIYMGQWLTSGSHSVHVSLTEHYADSPDFVRETPEEKHDVDYTGGAYDTDGYFYNDPNGNNIHCLDHLSGWSNTWINWERKEEINHQGHQGAVWVPFETEDWDFDYDHINLIKELP